MALEIRTTVLAYSDTTRITKLWVGWNCRLTSRIRPKSARRPGPNKESFPWYERIEYPVLELSIADHSVEDFKLSVFRWYRGSGCINCRTWRSFSLPFRVLAGLRHPHLHQKQLIVPEHGYWSSLHPWPDELKPRPEVATRWSLLSHVKGIHSTQTTSEAGCSPSLK